MTIIKGSKNSIRFKSKIIYKCIKTLHNISIMYIIFMLLCYQSIKNKIKP